jgi:GNAT superfamily N-acetyltransferase
MMTFSPVRTDDAALAQYGALFAACFPGANKYTPQYLKWQYADNPDGPVVGFDAWDGERLAAHYVCVPARARVAGEDVRVLLSLNTATHPDYQGKGLFTKLAAMTYNAGAEQGFDAVYGVANANSTPGFLRKLDFQLVRPLEARVGIGGIGNGKAAGRPAAFERLWSDAALPARTTRCACSSAAACCALTPLPCRPPVYMANCARRAARCRARQPVAGRRCACTWAWCRTTNAISACMPASRSACARRR